MNKHNLYAGIGFGLFCIGYLLINERILVQSILYRAAASDYHHALIAVSAMAIQATALLFGFIFLSNRLFWLFLILTGLSAVTNVIFSQILSDTLDLSRFHWLLTEARQAQNAVGEFAIPAAIALGKTLLALALFVGCRWLIRPRLTGQPHLSRKKLTGNLATLCILLLPSLAFGLGAPGPAAAERNIYGFAVDTLTIPPPPERQAVAMPAPDIGQSMEKIVWIVDESIGYDAFTRNILPALSAFRPVDFGKAAAMANCSAPAHVALRSGVDVVNVNAETDLRKTPSIWGYAKKAGYKTIFIDGQVSGPPQNLLLPPEARMIDEIRSAASGMETDQNIAQGLNTQLKTPGRAFVYVVLRGVHFQYSDHYPAGLLPPGHSLSQQYDTAITYSKQGFFQRLLAGVDRQKTAIIYTSDHGQNIQEGVTPHCATVPQKAEFAVPLLAFLPPTLAADFPARPRSRHSVSQIFPTTLGWMGYDRTAVNKAYDNSLALPPKKFVWFGRAVIPLRNGDRIEVSGSELSLVD